MSLEFDIEDDVNEAEIDIGDDLKTEEPKDGNLASSAAGAKVIATTSSDPRYPATNIIDGNLSLFWVTTGMFPHEFVIQLPRLSKISSIQLKSQNVKQLRVLRCDQPTPTNFQEVYTDILSRAPGIQSHQKSFNQVPALYLKDSGDGVGKELRK